MAQLCVMQNGTLKACSVQTVNCSGAGVSCAITNGKWQLTVSAVLADGGSIITLPKCSAGAVLDSDGGVLYCINTIANATLAATATALASNPADCSANQYANAIAANGDLTCAQVTGGQVSGAVATATALAANPADCSSGQYATTIAANGDLTCATVTGGQVSGAVATATALASDPTDCSSGQYANAIAASGNLTCAAVTTAQLSGTISNAQLASSYSGVGACSTHQWSSTLNANAAPTCTQPAFTDLSGTPLAGGSVPQVQYNADGGLGGMTNFRSDGVRPVVVAEINHPTAPNANSLHYDYSPNNGIPSLPFSRSSYMTLPIPDGVMSGPVLAPVGSIALWYAQCHGFQGWGSTTVDLNIGTTGALSSTAAGGTNQVLWALTSFKTRQRTNGYTSLASKDSIAALRQNQATSWRGNASNAGGFVSWLRTWVMSSGTTQQSFFGLAATTGEFTPGGAQPSSFADTVYIGCDTNEHFFKVCSNDNSGSATCSTLGDGGLPCTGASSNGVGFDLWLSAPPNGSAINYYVERIDGTAAFNANGSVSSDLPRNTVQLTMHSYMCSSDAGVAARQDFESWCSWDNL